MSLIVLIFIIIGFFGAVATDEPPARPVAEPVATVEVESSEPVCIVVDDTDLREDGCSEFFGWQPVQVGDIEGVIVTEDDGALFIGIEGHWTPTAAGIVDAEAAIAADHGLLDHTRQYVGYIEGGERKIFVNGFCDDFGIDWQTEPVLVDDGGECYFTAVYNLDAGELERFDYNGEG